MSYGKAHHSLAMGLVLASLGRAAPGVTIYVQSGPSVPVAVVNRAEWVASKIFASIGVLLKWHIGADDGRPRGEVEVAIEIQLDSGVPEAFHPGALAYATPYGTSGTRIHVFCDRVLRASSPELAGTYLGHTIAHEITHVLERISRHSAQGVMKAHWDIHDLSQMTFRPLAFAIEDVDLIHRALDRSQPR